MDKPKVTIITPGTFAIPSKRSSSVEQAVIHIGKSLASKVNLTIISRKKRKLSFKSKEKGISFRRIYYKNQLNYMKKTERILRSQHPSIIQVENRPRIAKYLKRKFPAWQVWLSLHSTTFISKPKIDALHLERCLSAVDKIIVNSFFLKERVAKKSPDHAHKIVVNHLGVNPQHFISKWTEQGQEMRTQMLQKLGYEGKKIILFAGRLIKIKGVHHILNVLPRIIPHFPDVVCVIVGSSRYGKNTVTPYVKKLYKLGNRMPQHVRFISFVAYEEMRSWYNIADVVVVPSNEEEAFGLVNVEAMASGVPVIATNGGGMKEIVQNKKTGLLVDPQQVEKGLEHSLLELLSNPEKCRMMGEAAVQRVMDHFTWQHVADRMHTLYLEHSSQ